MYIVLLYLLSYFTECTKVNVRNGQNIGKLNRKEDVKKAEKLKKKNKSIAARE